MSITSSVSTEEPCKRVIGIAEKGACGLATNARLYMHMHV